jgi:hypothetical protein
MRSSGERHVVIRRVDPVVEHPRGAVAGVLGVGLASQFWVVLARVVVGHQLLLVRLAVTVGVAEKPQPRRLRHEGSVLEEHDAAGHDQSVGKHGATIHPPVPVGVFEHGDRTDGAILPRAVPIAHVAGHLHHPEAAAMIELHRHRRSDQRLGCDQFHAGSPGPAQRSSASSSALLARVSREWRSFGTRSTCTSSV